MPAHPETEDADVGTLRRQARDLCAQFPDEYWRETDRNRRYPQEFVDALTSAGLLSALVPTEYGGLGVGLTEAGEVLEEINRSGGHSAACHAQMYTMGALLEHGSHELKDAYLPGIATGGIRLQAFSVTEDAAGSDTTSITTAAVPDGEDYLIPGPRTGRVASRSRTSPWSSRAPARRAPTGPAGSPSSWSTSVRYAPSNPTRCR